MLLLFLLFLLTIKIRLRKKSEIDLLCHFIFMPSHVSSPPLLRRTPNRMTDFFPETSVLFGRASAGFHCTMNPCAPPHFLPRGFFLVSTGCRFLRVLSVLRDREVVYTDRHLLGTGTPFSMMFGRNHCEEEPGSCFNSLQGQATVSFRGTLRNRCHIDASKCTTQLPHKQIQ